MATLMNWKYEAATMDEALVKHCCHAERGYSHTNLIYFSNLKHQLDTKYHDVGVTDLPEVEGLMN